jgi:hypothetical protein
MAEPLGASNRAQLAFEQAAIFLLVSAWLSMQVGRLLAPVGGAEDLAGTPEVFGSAQDVVDLVFGTRSVAAGVAQVGEYGSHGRLGAGTCERLQLGLHN